jgi:hypothetical protein
MSKTKEPIPKEHWERPYRPRVNKDSKTTRGEEFNPKLASKRMVTYEKVNETDH